MREYMIFSDSSCDVSPELIKNSGVQVVPFYISFDGENYKKENIEISNEEFYEQLLKGGVFPKTSLPSVEDYMNRFIEVLESDKDVLCICLTHNFSGSYQSAVNAKMILEEQYGEGRIVIVDSDLATAAQGLLVLQAVKMKEAGYTMQENEQKLKELSKTGRIMFTVDTLEYLQKGGRIGKAASLAGTMLNLKPLIILKQGELLPYSNIRGRKKALDKMIAMTEEHFKEIGARYEDYDFVMVNATTMDETKMEQERTEELIGRPFTYPVFPIGVTIGTYTGPGAVGICFIKKFNA